MQTQVRGFLGDSRPRSVSASHVSGRIGAKQQAAPPSFKRSSRSSDLG